ncbi:CWF19-like protein 2 isoform X1 [Lytechinus pictus]|uniref:CWF19-like protein 2 isoform X1 n=1 Tax=Lytechinus pictus TaxID=7653 RepID=UPI0030B9B5C7
MGTGEGNWLESPFLTAATSLADIRKKKNAEKEKEREKAQNLADADYSARELNPYWKDGGTGLPEERDTSHHQIPQPARKVGHGVDGGVSWLKKSYQRAVEQARESGRPVDDVVAERWGSVAEYERLLDEAVEASDGHSRGPPPGWRKRKDDDGDGRRREGGRRDDERDRRKDDRGGRDREDRYESRDKFQRYDSDSRRDLSSRGFKKPGDDGDSLRSKFQRPRDEGVRRDDRHRSRSSYDEGSSSRERSRNDDLPSWRKTGFKKPGENEDDSSTHSRSSSSRMKPPPASSSSSRGWRKQGFKRPDDEREGARSSPSSSGGWRKSSTYGPEKDDRHLSKDHSSSSAPPPLPSLSSASSKRSRRRSDSDEEHSDDAGSSGSSSPDSREGDAGGGNKEKERSPSPVKILSDTEMNQLGAKLVKAEIMGNEALAQKLKAEIESARQARVAHKTKQLESKEKEKAPSKKTGKRSHEEREEVILTRTDHSGQSWPLAEQTAPPTGGKKMKKKNIVTHDKGGERERYFADDDDVDLETMVRREKMGSSDDHNRLLNKVASKKLALLDSEFNTLDEMFVSSAAKAESKSKVEERERSKAIADHQHTMSRLSKCPFCLESEEMKKHLIVALGLKVYLCVPQTRCISEGQCYIVPMQHTVASTALDEDVWAEIQVFRKGLTRMFEDHEMDVAFLETCMNPMKQRHMCIECLPIPRELGEMAPIYFKKAIQESESEWTQNKKLIDTRKKDIRRSVPRGFPFFSVDFGLDGGFAHVIEDELVFPHYFGKEVIGGLLDVEPRLWRHPPKENFQDQSKRVLELSQWWKPFDWTKKIDREKS